MSAAGRDFDRLLRWGRQTLPRARDEMRSVLWDTLHDPVGRALFVLLLLVDPGGGKSWAARDALGRYRAEVRGVAVWAAATCKLALEAFQFFQDEGIPCALVVGRRRGAARAERFLLHADPKGNPSDVTTCVSPRALQATQNGLSPASLCSKEGCNRYADCEAAFYGYIRIWKHARRLLEDGHGIIVTTAASERGVHGLCRKVGVVPDVVVRDEHHQPSEIHIDEEALSGAPPGHAKVHVGELKGGAWSLQKFASVLPRDHSARGAASDLVASLERALRHGRGRFTAAAVQLREEERRRALLGEEPPRYRRDRRSAARLAWPDAPPLDEAAEIVRCGWGGWLARTPGVAPAQLARDASEVLEPLRVECAAGNVPWRLAPRTTASGGAARKALPFP